MRATAECAYKGGVCVGEGVREGAGRTGVCGGGEGEGKGGGGGGGEGGGGVGLGWVGWVGGVAVVVVAHTVVTTTWVRNPYHKKQNSSLHDHLEEEKILEILCVYCLSL